MNSDIVPDAMYMTITATMTAAIITSTCLAMPMAVTIESTENTRSMTMICPIMLANDSMEWESDLSPASVVGVTGCFSGVAIGTCTGAVLGEVVGASVGEGVGRAVGGGIGGNGARVLVGGEAVGFPADCA